MDTADYIQAEFEAYLQAVYPVAPKSSSPLYHQLRNMFFAGAFAAAVAAVPVQHQEAA